MAPSPPVPARSRRGQRERHIKALHAQATAELAPSSGVRVFGGWGEVGWAPLKFVATGRLPEGMVRLKEFDSAAPSQNHNLLGD